MFLIFAILIFLKYFFGFEYAFYVLPHSLPLKTLENVLRKRTKENSTVAVDFTPGFSGKPHSDSYPLLSARGLLIPAYPLLL